MKYDEVLELNNNKLTKKYIQSLSKQERLDLIDPIFNLLRAIGWIYPDDIKSVDKEWKRLLEFKPDINSMSLFNNSSLATKICKHFCHLFYEATEKDKKNMIEIFNDNELLKKIIQNRLGLDWLDDDERGAGVNEAFNLSFKMMIQGQRSMRLVNATSIFKPDIAKYMYTKYSDENDTVFDPSAGWGGRMLGAVSCNRKYIASDPLTTGELQNMVDYLKLKDVTLINSGSEHVKLDENSIDFSFTSPPYYDQEYYSSDSTQAYHYGEDYFYNVYWKNTLENIKYMLKPNKWFGLNILAKYAKMIDMTKEQFGESIEIVQLKTIKNHLNKKNSIEKFEPIYMFKNIK